MRFTRHLVLPASLAASLWTGVQAAYAQNIQVITSGLNGCDFVTGKMTAACIPSFIGHLIQIVFSVISVFFIINVLYAGYQIAFGYINGDKSEGADRLKWSIIGLVVSVCSFLILDLAVTIISP